MKTSFVILLFILTISLAAQQTLDKIVAVVAVSYTHLTLPTSDLV